MPPRSTGLKKRVATREPTRGTTVVGVQAPVATNGRQQNWERRDELPGLGDSFPGLGSHFGQLGSGTPGADTRLKDGQFRSRSDCTIFSGPTWANVPRAAGGRRSNNRPPMSPRRGLVVGVSELPVEYQATHFSRSMAIKVAPTRERLCQQQLAAKLAPAEMNPGIAPVAIGLLEVPLLPKEQSRTSSSMMALERSARATPGSMIGASRR